MILTYEAYSKQHNGKENEAKNEEEDELDPSTSFMRGQFATEWTSASNLMKKVGLTQAADPAPIV